MHEKTPLENLLEQMAELLKLVKSGAEKGVNEDAVPLDIDKRLDKLEKEVDAFTKMGEKVVGLSGLSSVGLRKYHEGAVEDLTPEAKALIEKTKQLQQQAEALEESYKTGVLPPPAVEKVAEDPEYGKHRRKKFKRFGGNDKWKPL